MTSFILGLAPLTCSCSAVWAGSSQSFNAHQQLCRRSSRDQLLGSTLAEQKESTVWMKVDCYIVFNYVIILVAFFMFYLHREMLSSNLRHRKQVVVVAPPPARSCSLFLSKINPDWSTAQLSCPSPIGRVILWPAEKYLDPVALGFFCSHFPQRYTFFLTSTSDIIIMKLLSFDAAFIS